MICVIPFSRIDIDVLIHVAQILLDCRIVFIPVR